MWPQDLLEMLQTVWPKDRLIQRIEVNAYGEFIILDTLNTKWLYDYRTKKLETVADWRKRNR